MLTLWQDLRYGARVLLKNPSFTAVAVLTLALCIGANTSIFSVINGVLLRPLPYRDAEALVSISTEIPEQGLRGIAVSFTKLQRIQEQAHTLESVGAYLPISATLTTSSGPEQISAAQGTRNLFEVLGVVPVKGRSFLPAEEQEGGADVAVISDNFWHSHYGGNVDVLGHPISLNGRTVTIIGVLPLEFRFPFQQPEPDVWLPRVFDNPSLGTVRIRSGASYLAVFARLKSGVSIAQSQSELDGLNRAYAGDFPTFVDAPDRLNVTSLKESLVGPIRLPLLVLFGTVGFLLMVGCANIASLLLARATTREKEVAIRRALGASHGRLIRQLLTESLLLSSLGGLAGMVLAHTALGLLRLLPPGTLPRAQDSGLDLTVLAFTALLSLITGIVFGLAPSLQMLRRDLHEPLKDGGRNSSGGRKGRRSRTALVVAEVTISVVLMMGAGVLIKSFDKVMAVHPGFDSANVMTFSLSLPQIRYPEPGQQAEFYRRLTEGVQALPGVRSAGVVSYLPLSGSVRYVFFCPEGTVCKGVGKDPIIAVRQITPDYFQTLRMPVLRGRSFNQQDVTGGKPVAIINQWTADHYFPNQNPIGKRLIQSRGMIETEIVGVVPNVKFLGLNTPYFQEMYLSQSQSPAAAMTLVVRSTTDAQSLVAAVRRKVLELDSDLPFVNVSSMQEVLSGSLTQQRLTSQFTGLFAGLALTLTAIGIYGVIAYSVAQRTHEIGVRMALGARRADILKLVIEQGMRLVLAGLALGCAASVVLTRLLQGLLFGTSPRDPITLAGVAIVLICVAFAACYVPARRAARVQPLIALRHS